MADMAKSGPSAHFVCLSCRFFFEELRGCGDVNAAAASALRRLADART